MLPRTAVHWQSSVGDGDKFGAEQLLGASAGPNPKLVGVQCTVSRDYL